MGSASVQGGPWSRPTQRESRGWARDVCGIQVTFGHGHVSTPQSLTAVNRAVPVRRPLACTGVLTSRRHWTDGLRAQCGLPLGLRGLSAPAVTASRRGPAAGTGCLHTAVPRSPGCSRGAGPHSTQLQPRTAKRFRFVKRPRPLGPWLPAVLCGLSREALTVRPRRPDVSGPGRPSAPALRRDEGSGRCSAGPPQAASPPHGLLGPWSARGAGRLPRPRWWTWDLRRGPGPRAQINTRL